MSHPSSRWRALLLGAALLSIGACVRQSNASDPAAAANIARAQVVESPVSDTPPAGTPSPADTPSATVTSDPTATAVAAVSPSPTVLPTPIPCRLGAFEDELDVEYEELDDTSGGKQNGIKLCNRKDERFRVKGRIQLNRISSDTVAPRNEAMAWASCRDCSTLSVAMQLNLYKRGATNVSPRNFSTAYNYKCTRCRTISLALQYSIPVDDPNDVPADVRSAIRDMDAELKALHADRSVTLAQAVDRVNSVAIRYMTLAQALEKQQREESADSTEGATS